MRFGQAIDDVTKYGKVMRRSWWDKENHVGFKLPDDRSDMTSAYFYQSFNYTADKTVDKIIAPWTPDIFDMTANDWELLDNE